MVFALSSFSFLSSTETIGIPWKPWRRPSAPCFFRRSGEVSVGSCPPPPPPYCTVLPRLTAAQVMFRRVGGGGVAPPSARILSSSKALHHPSSREVPTLSGWLLRHLKFLILGHARPNCHTGSTSSVPVAPPAPPPRPLPPRPFAQHKQNKEVLPTLQKPVSVR